MDEFPFMFGLWSWLHGAFWKRCCEEREFLNKFLDRRVTADDDCIRNLHANFHSIFLILWGQFFGGQKVLQQTFLHNQFKTLLHIILAL